MAATTSGPYRKRLLCVELEETSGSAAMCYTLNLEQLLGLFLVLVYQIIIIIIRASV
jgi:hypothetical protein